MLFDEASDGATYLSSLKQSGSPQAAGATIARAPDLLHSPETQTETAPTSNAGTTASTEERKSPRYRCKGSARLHESGSDVTIWATFADISMHGCYVEAASPLPVGTVLDLQLEVDGFRVEATGEVRVVYPSLGIGISFSKISEGDRRRLLELVGLISPPSVIVSPRVAPNSPSIAQADILPALANPGAALPGDSGLLYEPPHLGAGRIYQDSAQEPVAVVSSQ
jgi:hypothetical protein